MLQRRMWLIFTPHPETTTWPSSLNRCMFTSARINIVIVFMLHKLKVLEQVKMYCDKINPIKRGSSSFISYNKYKWSLRALITFFCIFTMRIFMVFILSLCVQTVYVLQLKQSVFLYLWTEWAAQLWTTGNRPSRWSWGQGACPSPPRSSQTPPSWTCTSRSVPARLSVRETTPSNLWVLQKRVRLAATFYFPHALCADCRCARWDGLQASASTTRNVWANE